MQAGQQRNTILGRAVALIVITFGCITPFQSQELAPANPWPAAQAGSVGLNAASLASFDTDIRAGKYGLVDSALVIRCGKQAFARFYSHDYARIYGPVARKEGPLNHDVNGPYNYFSAEFHPYFQHSDLHTMQSVSKSVTSATFGVAIGRKDFLVDLDSPILQFFGDYQIANVDERKRRITLRHLLTMTAGLQWNEDLPYNDPKNSADLMEARHDWVKYVIDQPMVAEPGKVFAYSSGVTELLAYIFKRVTGRNVDEYAAEHLFNPLGIRYHWKHSPTGLTDTEGGLYLSSADLAKIGFLYLHNGVWNHQQIVPQEWVKASLTPNMDVEDEGEKWKYGFQWWLQPYSTSPERLFSAARGFGGQQLLVVPDYELIVVFTGWGILPTAEYRCWSCIRVILDAVDKQFGCGTTTN